MIYTYRCWKCKTKHRIEQEDETELTFLKCTRCGRSLLRVNQAPGVVTDSTFMSGSHVDDGFGACEWLRKEARKKAAAAGVDTNGARYCSELCPKGERLSPKAWIKNRSDVAERVKELGVGCEGSVNVQAPEFEPSEQKPYKCADWIVERRVEKKLEQIGEPVTPKEREELWHKEAALASGSA